MPRSASSCRKKSPGWILFFSMFAPSMIIHHLYVDRVHAVPVKSDSVLIIDANAVLVLSCTLELFQTKALPAGQVFQGMDVVEKYQFSICDLVQKIGEFPPGNSRVNLLSDVARPFIPEAPNRHLMLLYCIRVIQHELPNHKQDFVAPSGALGYIAALPRVGALGHWRSPRCGLD